MAKQFRKLDQLMMSLGDKEASYDAGPAAWTLGAAFQAFEFGEAFAAWDDGIVTDEDAVHGTIWPTKSEIIRQDARFTYSEPRVRPVFLAGLAALVGGVVSPSQDPGKVAYRHKCTPVAQAVVLPSIGLIEKASGEQYLYTGIKCDTFRLRRGGPQRAYFEMEAGLIGSGTRAIDTTEFPAKVIAESPLTWGKAQCWLETGADISIAATPTQGSQDISSGAPDNLTSRILDFEFEAANDLQADDGYIANSGKVRGRLDHGLRRGGRIRLVLVVDETTLAAERDYYNNRNAMAIEFEVNSGILIASGGTMYYGFDLIIPLLHLDPIARGVQDGFNTITLTGVCYDDLAHDLWQLYVYNAQTAYLA
jgi:hypothetical protein